jgi:hypothetical protein
LERVKKYFGGVKNGMNENPTSTPCKGEKKKPLRPSGRGLDAASQRFEVERKGMEYWKCEFWEL